VKPSVEAERGFSRRGRRIEDVTLSTKSSQVGGGRACLGEPPPPPRGTSTCPRSQSLREFQPDEVGSGKRRCGKSYYAHNRAVAFRTRNPCFGRQYDRPQPLSLAGGASGRPAGGGYSAAAILTPTTKRPSPISWTSMRSYAYGFGNVRADRRRAWSWLVIVQPRTRLASARRPGRPLPDSRANYTIFRGSACGTFDTALRRAFSLRDLRRGSATRLTTGPRSPSPACLVRSLWSLNSIIRCSRLTRRVSQCTRRGASDQARIGGAPTRTRPITRQAGSDLVWCAPSCGSDHVFAGIFFFPHPLRNRHALLAGQSWRLVKRPSVSTFDGRHQEGRSRPIAAPPSSGPRECPFPCLPRSTMEKV